MNTFVDTGEEKVKADKYCTYSLFILQDKVHFRIQVQILIDDVPVEMQYDTGAAFLLTNQGTSEGLKKDQERPFRRQL